MLHKHLLRPAPVSILVFAAGILFAGLPSFGQKGSPSLGQKADINVNIYGTFPTAATSSGPFLNGRVYPALRQTAEPSAGFRIGARYVFTPRFGLEANFGYNRATQHFAGGLQNSGVVYSHGKAFNINYVATSPKLYHGFRPFALVGAGLIYYNISSFAALPARSEVIPVFSYGGGADYHPSRFPNFMAMRFQYIGLVGHAPDYLLPYLATTNVINIAEPEVGLVFKF